MNVLKSHLQTTLRTLIERNASQREIERVTGIDRKTIRSYQKRFTAELSNSPGVTTDRSGHGAGIEGHRLKEAAARLTREAIRRSSMARSNFPERNAGPR